MEAILISIHARWCAKIMNGDKTIEVRRGTALYKAIQKEIDKNGYAEFYVYCTKGKTSVNVWTANIPEKVSKAILSINEKQSNDELDYFMNVEFPQKYPQYAGDRVSFSPTNINGKVPFKFRCYNMEEIWHRQQNNNNTIYHYARVENQTVMQEDLMKQSCLPYNELHKYLDNNQGTAIHISDLEIFDKPKELSEFDKREKIIECYNAETNYHIVQYRNRKLTKTPRSWCYVEVE